MGKLESTPLVNREVDDHFELYSWRTVHVVAASCAYLVLNIGFNFLNKHVVGKGDGMLGKDMKLNEIIIFYTTCHQLVGLLFYSCLLITLPSQRSLPHSLPVQIVWARHLPWLIGLGFFFSTSIVTQNMSLGEVSLTVNSIVKSIMPLPTVVFAYFLQSYRPSPLVSGSLVVIIAGVLLACLSAEQTSGDQSSSIKGYMFIFYSLIATALRPVVAGRIFEAAKKDDDGTPISAASVGGIRTRAHPSALSRARMWHYAHPPRATHRTHSPTRPFGTADHHVLLRRAHLGHPLDPDCAQHGVRCHLGPVHRVDGGEERNVNEQRMGHHPLWLVSAVGFALH